MLSKARLDQITEMEGILNEANDFLAEAEAFWKNGRRFYRKWRLWNAIILTVTGVRIMPLMNKAKFHMICLAAYWAKIRCLMRALCNGNWQCNG